MQGSKMFMLYFHKIRLIKALNITPTSSLKDQSDKTSLT